MTINELKDIKKEITKQVWNMDDWTLTAYQKGYEAFINRIAELNKKHLSTLSVKEIKFINFINRINKFDLEYMFMI